MGQFVFGVKDKNGVVFGTKSTNTIILQSDNFIIQGPTGPAGVGITGPAGATGATGPNANISGIVNSIAYFDAIHSLTASTNLTYDVSRFQSIVGNSTITETDGSNIWNDASASGYINLSTNDLIISLDQSNLRIELGTDNTTLDVKDGSNQWVDNSNVGIAEIDIATNRSFITLTDSDLLLHHTYGLGTTQSNIQLDSSITLDNHIGSIINTLTINPTQTLFTKVFDFNPTGTFQTAMVMTQSGSYAIGIGGDIDLMNVAFGNSAYTRYSTNGSQPYLSLESNDFNGTTTFRVGSTLVEIHSFFASFPGMQYINDYSANFSTRSIPDVGYVESLIAAATSSIPSPTLTNVLITGNTTGNKSIIYNGIVDGTALVSTQSSFYIGNGNIIDLTNAGTYSSIYFGDPAVPQMDIYVTDGSTFYSELALNDGGAAISVSDLIDNTQLIFLANGITRIRSSHANYAGLQYNDDYSANYTTHSLVTFYDLSMATVNVGNGLQNVGGTVSLGGYLTQNTTIDGGSGFNMLWGDNSLFSTYTINSSYIQLQTSYGGDNFFSMNESSGIILTTTTGSIYIQGRGQLYNGSNSLVVDWQAGQLSDGSQVTLDWYYKTLISNRIAPGQISFDWNLGHFYDDSNNLTISTGMDDDSPYLMASGQKVIQWGNQIIVDTSNVLSIDWGNRTLNSSAGQSVMNYGSDLNYQYLIDPATNQHVIQWNSTNESPSMADGSGAVSIFWFDRHLLNAAGDILLDWSGSDPDVNSHKITSVATGSSALDAVNYGQMNTAIASATASILTALKTKSGTVAKTSFSGSPLTFAVSFAHAFSSTSYSINIIGTDLRSWSYSNKATTGFTIQTNDTVALNGNVDWIAIANGEN